MAAVGRIEESPVRMQRDLRGIIASRESLGQRRDLLDFAKRFLLHIVHKNGERGSQLPEDVHEFFVLRKDDAARARARREANAPVSMIRRSRPSLLFR